MLIGRTTTLNNVEQRLVKTVASMRNKDNRMKGIPDRKIGGDDSVSLDVQGFGGEIAFSKTFNVYPDLVISARRSAADEGDVKWNGLRIDVKATPRDEGDLLVPVWKKKNAEQIDGYALMTGAFPTYCYRGMITTENVFQEHWLRDLGRGDTYVVPQNELKELI